MVGQAMRGLPGPNNTRATSNDVLTGTETIQVGEGKMLHKSDQTVSHYYKKVPQLSVMPAKHDQQQQQPNFVAMQQKISEKLLSNQNVQQQHQQTSPKGSFVNYVPLQKITVNNDKIKNNYVLMETPKTSGVVQSQFYTVQPNKHIQNTYLAMTPKSDNTTYLMSQSETYVVAPKAGETAYLVAPTNNKTDIIMLPSGQQTEKLSLLPNGKTYVKSEPGENNVPHSHQYLIPNMLNMNNMPAVTNKVKEEPAATAGHYNYVKKERKYNNMVKYKSQTSAGKMVMVANNSNTATTVTTFAQQQQGQGEDVEEGVEVRPVFDPRYPLVYQVVMADHNYVQSVPVFRDRGPPDSQLPPLYGAVKKEDDQDSLVSSDCKSDDDGEETETAAEDEDCSITRCICDMEHDDGYMVCCDKCLVWQHVACVYPDMKPGTPLTGDYLCDACQPRKLDRKRARTIQMQRSKQIEKNMMESSDSSSSSLDIATKQNHPPKKSVARRRAEPVQRKPSKVDQGRAGTGGSRMKRTGMMKEHHLSSKVDHQPAVSVNNTGPAMGGAGGGGNVSNCVGRRNKKKLESKVQLRRKSKNKEEKEVVNNCSGGAVAGGAGGGSNLREWIENYEEAVTNHYTQELRNRLKDVLKHVGGGDLNIRSGSGVRCRVSQNSMKEKSLVATCNLAYGQPIIELKGNFMLLGQESPKSELLFHYKLPKDETEIVVDVSKYGNCSRYVRRSCRPNSQIKHSVEKNCLRLFLVTCSNLEKNQEITLGHGSWLNKTGGVRCACDGRNCTSSQSERRRRGRRRTVSEDSGGSPPVKYNMVRREVLVETRRNSSVVAPTSPPTSPSPTSPQYNEKDKDRKLTRDERKIEQAMKIFAQMERDTARKKDKDHQAPHHYLHHHHQQQQQPPTHHNHQQQTPGDNIGLNSSGGATTRSRKTSQNNNNNCCRDDNSDKESPTTVTAAENNEQPRPKRRKRRKGRINTTNNDTGLNNNRRLRFNSADSDMTSADEVTSPVRGRTGNRDSSVSPVKGRSLRLSSRRSRERDTMNDAAGVLLALSGSRTPPRHQHVTPQAPLLNSEGECSPHTPLSSACLLVAAAVGPLAPGFKFPKTKKGMMNEWLSKSPEPVTTDYPQQPPLLVDSPNQPSCVKDLTLPPGAPKLSNLSSRLFSLAAAAEAEEREKVGGAVAAAAAVAGDQMDARGGSGGGFAKKRWLRQAISEEYEAPSSSQPDNITPLKKRRLARESMSSDPPSTPPPLSSGSYQTGSDRNGDVNSPESEPTMLDAESEISLTERVNALCREYYEVQQGNKSPDDSATTVTSVSNSNNNNNNNSCEEKPLDLTGVKVTKRTRGRKAGSKKSTEPIAVNDLIRQSPRLRKCESRITPPSVEERKTTTVTDEVKCESKQGGDGDEECGVKDGEEVARVKIEEMTVKVEEEVKVKPELAEEDVKKIDVKEEVKEEKLEAATVSTDCVVEEVKVAEAEETTTLKLDQVEATRPGTDEDLTHLEECSSNDKSNDAPTDLLKCCTDEEKIAPAKRKLSITEYRNRKKCLTSSSSSSGCKNNCKDGASQQASVASPLINSDDEVNCGDVSPLLLPPPPILLDKELTLGKPGGVVRFKPEPTELERQRENLTERLRREFGLHIPDDEPRVEPPHVPPPTTPPPPPPPPQQQEETTPDYEYFNQESAIYPVGSSNPPNPNIVTFTEIDRSLNLFPTNNNNNSKNSN